MHIYQPARYCPLVRVVVCLLSIVTTVMLLRPSHSTARHAHPILMTHPALHSTLCSRPASRTLYLALCTMTRVDSIQPIRVPLPPPTTQNSQSVRPSFLLPSLLHHTMQEAPRLAETCALSPAQHMRSVGAQSRLASPAATNPLTRHAPVSQSVSVAPFLTALSCPVQSSPHCVVAGLIVVRRLRGTPVCLFVCLFVPGLRLRLRLRVRVRVPWVG